MATLLIAVVMGLMVPWLNRMMNATPTEAEGLVPGQSQA
jgi:POT family proton-dependent oligopeptide transporter